MNLAKIRKQVYDLTIDDLDKFPIWEYALDEESEYDQDEATVRPWTRHQTPDPKEDMVVVRTKFIAKDKTIYHGYCSPNPSHDLGYIQPTIITAGGQVNFWCGMFGPKQEELDKYYKILGKNSEELFPLTFNSEVKELPVQGTVEGFLYSPNADNDKVKTAR
jgi:hypothetical protein